MVRLAGVPQCEVGDGARPVRASVLLMVREHHPQPYTVRGAGTGLAHLGSSNTCGNGVSVEGVQIPKA